MKFKKGVATLICTAMLLATVTGCGGTSTNESNGTDSSASETTTLGSGEEPATTEAAEMVDSVTMGLNADIPSLSCYDGTSTGKLYTYKLFNDSLFIQEVPGGELVPCIGKEYSQSDDGATVTVKIFDYVHDSADNPIKASDVVFSYQTHIATGNAANVDPYVESIEAVDDTTIVFHLKDFKQIGALQCVLTDTQIVSESAYDVSSWSTSPIGCGPYVIESYTPGAKLTLKANENYWQTDEKYISYTKKQNVKEINYKVILEDAQLALALETGDVDIVNYVSADNLPFFADDEGNALDGYYVQGDNVPYVTNMSFSMDASSNVSGDVNLRKAILYAIDKTSLVNTVLGNTGHEVFCLGTDEYFDYDPEWAKDYYNYDVDKAKECLAQSDYVANGSPTIRIALETSDSKQKAAQMIQSYLSEIGINSEILSCDAALFTNYKLDFSQWDIKIDQNGNPTYTLAAFWARFLGYDFCSYRGNDVNFFGLHDETLQKLLTVASNVDTKSNENTAKCNDYINDNAFAYGLWTTINYQAAQDGILEIVNDAITTPLPNAFVYAADYQSVVK